MPAQYWPWWLGGTLLATVALFFPLLNAAPLGVSGALARLLRWRQDPSINSTKEQLSAGDGCAPAANCDSPGSATAKKPDKIANLLFLFSIVLGGALAAFSAGFPWGRIGLGTDFQRLFGHGAAAIGVLFGGGLLVGFGTRWAGGCTSGHGLSGCGRLQPASLIATAIFFGIAIATSFALERFLA